MICEISCTCKCMHERVRQCLPCARKPFLCPLLSLAVLQRSRCDVSEGAECVGFHPLWKVCARRCALREAGVTVERRFKQASKLISAQLEKKKESTSFLVGDEDDSLWAVSGF